MPTPCTYTRAQILLHWAVALLVLLLYMPVSHSRVICPCPDSWLTVPLPLHVIAGFAILPLVAWRLALRQVHDVPCPESLEPDLLRGVGRLAHLTMYGLLIVLPLTGAAMWFFGYGWARTLHEVLRVLFLGLVGLHSIAALMHHFALRNGVLRRMLRPAPPPPLPPSADWQRTKCTLKT